MSNNQKTYAFNIHLDNQYILHKNSYINIYEHDNTL